MEFINQAVTVLQTLVVALGAGLAVWGVVNLMEGYGNDNPGANLAETEANLKALGTLRDAAKMERIYGNCKGSSLRALKAALPRE